MPLLRTLLLLPLFFIVTANAAEQPIAFERFADEFGGRQASVYGIAKDARGFLWFAGDTDGLLRFDGYQLSRWAEGDESLGRVSYSAVLVTDDKQLWAASWGSGLLLWNHETSKFIAFNSDNSPLPDNRVQSLFHDSAGQLWVGTLNGLAFAHKTGVNALAANNPLRQERIWGIAESDQALWFATTSGLYRTNLANTEWQQYLPFPEQLGNNRINEIRTVRVIDDRIWVGLDGGMFEFIPATGTFIPVTFPAEFQGTKQLQINTLYPGEGDALWVGAENGVYRINTDTRTFMPFPTNTFVLAQDIDIRQIISDPSGTIWLGSRDQGIFRSKPAGANIQLLAPTAAEPLAALLQRSISVVYVSNNNDLWLGIPNGVARWQPQQKQWRYWLFPTGGAQRRAEAILTDSYGRTWVGSNASLFYVDENDEELTLATDIIHQLNAATTAVTALTEDSNGQLWFGFWGRGLASLTYHPTTESYTAEWRFNALGGLRGDLIYSIKEQENRGLWLLTRFSGLWFNAHNSDTWVAAEQQLGSESWQGELPTDGLLCLYFRTDNELWLCSEDGLWQVDFAQQTIQRFGREHGLPSERVLGITSGPSLSHDNTQALWLTTSRGIAALELDSLQFINLGISDGLPAWEFLRAAIAQDGLGNIVAGSVRGAVTFTPENLSINRTPPQVGLSRIWVDDEDITGHMHFAKPQLELPRQHRSLVLQYSVLDYKEITANAGRYRVVGLNDEWSPWSESRQLIFTSLPPGNFVLEIEGRNSLGIATQEPLRIYIAVKRPWWESPWVWAMLGMLLLALFIIAVQLRYAALARLNKRLDIQVQERTKELEALALELKEQSHTDYLTKLPNRRGFTAQFDMAVTRAKRSKLPLCLVLFDVDHFKQFNDQHGHDAGDAVLVNLAQLVKQHIRAQDSVARWGGEEFAILLPDTPLQGAMQVCETLRTALAAMVVRYQDQELRVTATFGVYQGNPQQPSLQKWVHCADEALYAGKNKGRNRVQPYEVN